MFQDALREIVDQTEGGVASLIMDSEGIAVDSYARDGASFDINVVGIEYGVVLGSIKRAAESLEAGQAHEVAIGTDKLITLIRTLGDTYFLALTLRPDGPCPVRDEARASPPVPSRLRNGSRRPSG